MLNRFIFFPLLLTLIVVFSASTVAIEEKDKNHWPSDSLLDTHLTKGV